MKTQGFTAIIYRVCPDGLARQVLGVDSRYLESMIAERGTNGFWRQDITDGHYIVFATYTQVDHTQWKHRISRKWLEFWAKRRLNRSAHGRFATPISTPHQVTGAESRLRSTGLQASPPNKPILTETTTKLPPGFQNDGTPPSASYEDIVTLGSDLPKHPLGCFCGFCVNDRYLATFRKQEDET